MLKGPQLSNYPHVLHLGAIVSTLWGLLPLSFLQVWYVTYGCIYLFLFNHLYPECLLVGFVSWAVWPLKKTVTLLLNSVSIPECWTFAPACGGWWEAEAVLYCICHGAWGVREQAHKRATCGGTFWRDMTVLGIHLLHANSFRFTSGLVYGLIHWRGSLCCFPVCLFPHLMEKPELSVSAGWEWSFFILYKQPDWYSWYGVKLWPLCLFQRAHFHLFQLL